MDALIAVAAGLLAVSGALLQLILLFAGLAVLGRNILLFLSKKKAGWFDLWGAWHVAVFSVIFKLDSQLSQTIDKFQTVAFQLEGVRITAMYLILPLVVSFTLSRAHLYLRARLANAH